MYLQCICKRDSSLEFCCLGQPGSWIGLYLATETEVRCVRMQSTVAASMVTLRALEELVWQPHSTWAARVERGGVVPEDRFRPPVVLTQGDAPENKI